MIIGHANDTLLHESMGIVQGAAHERIFEQLGIAEKIEAIANEFAEQVLPYSGDMERAKKQALQWIVQSLADDIAAEARYELLLIE